MFFTPNVAGDTSQYDKYMPDLSEIDFVSLSNSNLLSSQFPED